MARLNLSDEDREILMEGLRWLYVQTPDSGAPDWAPIEKHHKIERLQKRLTDLSIRCDTAIGHGPGHQSVSECITTGPHTEHESDMGHEWSDSDIGKQTSDITRYTGPNGEPVTKTYRLAFEPY